MSRSEDYLDNLLTSVTDKLSEFDDDFEQNRESLKESYQTQNDLPSKTQSALDEIREENFLREFENELNKGKADDDFLADFERELNGEADHAYDSLQSDHYVHQMQDIVGHTEQADEFPLEIDNMPQDSMDADLEELFREDNSQPYSSPEPVLDDDAMTTFFNEPAAAEADDAPVTAAFEDAPQTVALEDDPVTAVLQDQPAAAALDEDPATVAFEDDPVTAAFEAPQPDMGEDGISQMANEQEKSIEAPKGMEGLEDIFGDILGDDVDSLLNELENGTQDTNESSASQDTEPILDERLKEILDGSDEEALSEIDQLLDADEGSTQALHTSEEDPLSMGPDFSYEEASIPGEGELGEKKKKERNKNGLFGRLSRVLFGTPQELDPEAAAEYAAAKEAYDKTQEDPKVVQEKKKQEKALKKQQKKEEAEKKKQEKAAAKAEKAAQKASKPKKEKKPKQKNQAPKEPPLPKVPVLMMWVLALSMMVLVFLGTSFVGYSAPVRESKEAFEKGDYVTAYTKLQGINVRAADEDLLHASSALAGIQAEMDAYTALMEQKQYEMALDALIRGYGRCLSNSADAEEWGVLDELTNLQNQFDRLLKEQFDVSKRSARKMYQIKKRSEYTLALHEILDGLGMEH